MIEIIEVKHHIQKHILSILMHAEHARYRDMRPPRVDTNLYSYHLKQLISANLVEKLESGYSLSSLGVMYADRINVDTGKMTPQPKVITMLVLQDSEGRVAMYEKPNQPFIGQLTVPLGKVHVDDVTVMQAARREMEEKTGVTEGVELTHAGDAYIRVSIASDIGMTTLAHVFYGRMSAIAGYPQLQWIPVHEIEVGANLAPAVREIVLRTVEGGDHFFEEFAAAMP